MKMKLNTPKNMTKKVTLYSVIRKIEGTNDVSVITTRSNAECREYIKSLASDSRICDVKFFGRGQGFAAVRYGRTYTFEIVKTSKIA